MIKRHACFALLFLLMSTGYTLCSLSRSSSERKTQLHRAVEKGNFEKCQRIIVLKNRPVNAVDETRSTALHHAAYHEDYRICELLLKHKTNDLVNLANGFGNTALHYAALKGNYHICSLLIEHGASLTAVNSNGQKPYDCIPAVLAHEYNFACSEPIIFDFELSAKTDLENLLKPLPRDGKHLNEKVAAPNYVPLDNDSHIKNIRKPLFIEEKKSDEDFWTCHHKMR